MDKYVDSAPGGRAIVAENYSSVSCAGAVIGGWLVATAIAMVLYAVGVSIGVGTISAADAEVFSKKVAGGAAIWMLVTWAVALYIGGYFSGAVLHNQGKKEAKMAGMAVWALSIVMTLLVGATGLGAAGLATLSVVGKAAEGAAMASPYAAHESSRGKIDVPASYKASVKRSVALALAGPNADAKTMRKAVDQLDADTMTAISESFITGDAQSAKDAIALNTSLSDEEADRVIAELNAKTEEAKEKAKQAADKAAAYTVFALWAGIITSIVSLFAAKCGAKAGMVGCGKCHSESERSKVVNV